MPRRACSPPMRTGRPRVVVGRRGRPSVSAGAGGSTKILVDTTKVVVDTAGMTREVPKPTEGELSILRVLWERGPSTVRDVHDAIQRGRPSGQTTGYTTVLKLLQIMTEKGLVTRDE